MNTGSSNSIASLAVRGLTCSRYDELLFADLDFTVIKGQLIQIQGGNGSGKTTLLKILCGFIEPEEGEIQWNDINIKSITDEYNSELIYIGHNNGIKSGLTCIENLKVSSALASAIVTRDYEQVLIQYGLGGYEDAFAYSLSAGQRRRLALARLSIIKARLWILDEPFNSLDENGKIKMKKKFSDHLQSGGIIVMTSHDAIQWDEIDPVRLTL